MSRLLGILISLLLLVWVLRAFDLAEVSRALQMVNYFYLLPVAVMMVLNFAVRALRWGTLFGDMKSPRWASLFVAMMIGYLTNNVLPARAGKFVRAYVLGQREKMVKSTVLAVVVERVVDLVVASVVLSIVLLFYPLSTWLRCAGLIVGLVSLAALIFLPLMNMCGFRLVDWMVNLMKFLPETGLRRIEAVA